MKHTELESIKEKRRAVKILVVLVIVWMGLLWTGLVAKTIIDMGGL